MGGTGTIGNGKSNSNKGNNFPFQNKAWHLLAAIAAGTTPAGGLATESTLIQVLAALQNGREFEQLLVVDEGGVGCPGNCPTYIQVRIWNSGSGTFDPPVYYDATGAIVVPVGPLTLVNPQYLLESLLVETQSIDTRLAGAVRNPVFIRSTANGNTPAGVQSLSITFRGTNGTLNGAPIPNNYTVSFAPNKGEDTLASMPYTVPTGGAQEVLIAYVI